jgi:NAD(P)H-nitrite reductase large subunit
MCSSTGGRGADMISREARGKTRHENREAEEDHLAGDIGKRYVIIGNGIAGTTCAQALRKNDPSCYIWLITSEPYPLYNRVSLKRMLDGVLPEQKVMMRDFAWHDERRITLLTETRVIYVDTEQQLVYLDRGGLLRYDAMLVASGGRANALQVPGGAEAPHIHSFVSLDDTKEIIARALESKTAVTTGGSYMAYDLTEGLHKRGIHVTWLMRGPYWLRRILDRAGGELVDEIVTRHGIEIVHGEEIQAIIPGNGMPTQVVSTSGKSYAADLVGTGIGLLLNHEFLSDTQVQRQTGIITNEYLETHVPNVYAAGDVAEFYDPLTGRHRMLGTWDNALSQGKLAALNMAGGHEPHVDVPVRSSPIFDTNIVTVGMPENDNPELTSISRITPGEKGGKDYRKFFFQGYQLVGSVFIGSPKGRRKIEELIRAKQEFPTQSDRERLFDIR